MASRTTSELVAGIIEVEAGVDLTPFIDTANLLVTDVCGGYEYSDAKLEMIERWLSAHFYAVFDPRMTAEAAGSVRAAYESKVGLNLAVTRYGQQAMLLDTEGGLAGLNAQATAGRPKIQAGITWLGTDYDTTEAED